MRKLALALTLALPLTAFAQNRDRADVPPALISGMDAYRHAAPEDALKSWARNSPLDGTGGLFAHANDLRAAQALYGNFQGYDIISNRELSNRVRILYVTINYEHGPLFCRFVYYHSEGNWILTALDFSTDDTKLLPYTIE